MATLTITPANVFISNDNNVRHVFAAEAITVGQLVFRSGGVDGLYNLVDTDALLSAPLDLDGSEYGIALSDSSASGQPLSIARTGAIVSFGTILATNEHYFGDVTAGAISDTEAASTKFGVAVGFALDSTSMSLNFAASGVATP